MQRLINVAAIVFYVALVVFLFFYIKSIDFAALTQVTFDWRFIVIASIFGLSMRYWQVFIWFIILRGLGAKELENNRVQLAYVYAKTWLGRYIPGTAPSILGKIYFASRYGISKNKLVLSSLLEGILQVTAVFALGSLLLTFDPRLAVIDSNLKLVMGLLLLACIACIVPPIFNRALALVYRIFRRKKLTAEHFVSARVVVKGSLLYVIGALLYGLFLFFIAKAIYPELGYDNMLFVMGAGSLAGALGILAIFTPSGLGVREGIQLLLLGLIVPAEVALIITILTRLWDIVLDLLFFVVAWALQTRRPTS